MDHRRYTPTSVCKCTALSGDVDVGNEFGGAVGFANQQESRVSLWSVKTWKRARWTKTPKRAGWVGSIRAGRRLRRREWEVVGAEKAVENMGVGCALDMEGREKVEEQVGNQRNYGTPNKKSRSVESSLGSSTFRRVGETCLTAGRGRMNACQHRHDLPPEHSPPCYAVPMCFGGLA